MWKCGNMSIAKMHTSNKVWITSGSKFLGALVFLIADGFAKPELESFGLNHHRVHLAINVLQMQCTMFALQCLYDLLAQTE